MLVLIDESGDTGFKLGRGSSTHFVVTAVCFRDRSVAQACNAAIDDYRRTAGLRERFEFHFSQTPANLMVGLLRIATSFDFSFVAAVVEKASINPGTRMVKGTDLHTELTSRTLRLLPDLTGATVVIDGKKPKPLQSQIERRLKQTNDEKTARVIKNVKFGRSEGDNLLQLADAVSGAIFHSVTKGDDSLRVLVRRHEQGVQFDF